MESRTLARAFAAAVVFCSIQGPASAGVITAITAFSLPGFSTGSLTVGAAAAPNNDNAAAASPNGIAYSSIFLNAGGLGNADIEFAVENSGGTTEYRFFAPPFAIPVINNTGQSWTDFHFRLGFGTGAGFIASASSDLLDFDTPDADPTPVSSVFTSLSHQSDALDWSGATVPSVGPVRFAFAIDVPDNLQLVNPSGLNRFTLRFAPGVAATVPEPSTTMLLLAGVAGIGGIARRQRARKTGR